MALARVTTWNPGDTLTAAALNGEINNVLNNPISLISPTTGAINFQTSVAHSNLQVASLTASSGFAGSVLITSTAATPVPMWSTGAVSGGVFVATTGSIPTWLSIGSSGQVLIAATSGVAQWSTILTVSTGGLNIGTSVASGSPTNVTIPNINDYNSVNAAGTNILQLIGGSTGDAVLLARGGLDIQWGTALVALGGGAGATLGTVAGGGPPSAAQKSWAKIRNSTGGTYWFPVWSSS